MFSIGGLIVSGIIAAIGAGVSAGINYAGAKKQIEATERANMLGLQTYREEQQIGKERWDKQWAQSRRQEAAGMMNNILASSRGLRNQMINIYRGVA